MNKHPRISSKPSSSSTREWSPPHPDFCRKIARLIAKLPVAMLTTSTPEGVMRSRPMATLDQPCENAEVWFLSKNETPKTAEIAGDHEVNLSYSDPGRLRYVSLSGVAAIVRDPERVRRFWNESAAAWFPEGPDDPQIVLLRVRVHTAQAWNSQGRCENLVENPPAPASPDVPRSSFEANIEEQMRHGS